MDISSNSKISFEELNLVFGSMREVYATLSQKYYLPSLTSKAITKKYLTLMMLSGTNILKVPPTIKRHYIEYKIATIPEMHEKLEAFLIENNQPLTGLDALHLPDYHWIYDVCVWIDPINKIKLSRTNAAAKDSITRMIDQE